MRALYPQEKNLRAQTHSQRARRRNKEKQTLTLWKNGESFGLRLLHRLRLFYYAILPSLRRFYSHPPSRHTLRHRSSRQP